MAQDLPEYAEQYSFKERIRILAWGTIAGSIFIAVCELYFFPWLHRFTPVAHCYNVFGINGLDLLFYGIFSGFPFLMGLSLIVIMGYYSYRILRDGQSPPIGQKVTRPTKIKRGNKAKLIAYLNLIPGLLLIVISVWGVTIAEPIVSEGKARIDNLCKEIQAVT